MIYCLYGSDSYSILKKSAEIQNAYRAKHRYADIINVDFNDDVYAEKPERWNEVREFLMQPSMFASKKLAIVRNASALSLSGWVKTLKAFLTDPDVFLVLTDTKKPPTAMSFLTKKPVESQECEVPTGTLLDAFVVREGASCGIAFDTFGLRSFTLAITNRVCPDGKPTKEQIASIPWCIVHELERLALAKLPQPISGKALAPFVDTVRGSVRDSIATIARTPAGVRRLAALEEALIANAPAPYVFNTLVYMTSGEASIALAAHDIAIKSGLLDYEIALTAFAIAV